MSSTVTDLPDYTRLVTQNVTVKIRGTKAETVEHLTLTDNGVGGVTINITPSEEGKKVGLLKIIVSSETSGARFFMKARQSDVATMILNYTLLTADLPLVLDYPCYKPKQDASDATNPNIVLKVTSGCADKGYLTVIYFEEDA